MANTWYNDATTAFKTFRNERTRNLTVHVNKTSVECHDVEELDWGFHFFTDTELDAYKAAYAYRHSPHGVKVEFAGGVRRWMVTVWNELASKNGMNK